ncbi:hypothetical protein H310_04206 [Aphanomyces invadans]|uniref:Uncharacterized protein n=1 Tax=Aphanomyces invadans TaxID=157072 RepID=A0A024UFQ1_9STRA|nr:hypothetical protein H310_04206 [Aphanomyces invadans]ETW05236.1 hypothetical protein H310_04206 [Aphanomyces invadans]|eukprot:XP_008866674.1 hypothetical protein H310_04206 [Aphanomyces invadans]
MVQFRHGLIKTKRLGIDPINRDQLVAHLGHWLCTGRFRDDGPIGIAMLFKHKTQPFAMVLDVVPSVYRRRIQLGLLKCKHNRLLYMTQHGQHIVELHLGHDCIANGHNNVAHSGVAILQSWRKHGFVNVGHIRDKCNRVFRERDAEGFHVDGPLE